MKEYWVEVGEKKGRGERNQLKALSGINWISICMGKGPWGREDRVLGCRA